ncbi:MAG: ParB/RepB/Spo0J family partition protein, partial [Nitrospinota bacterium]
QPLLVRRHPLGGYELVAGERRLRAAAQAGLERVPALLVEAEGGEALVLALIENVQRTDLSPIEEATAYRHLVETFDLTQEEVAARVGKDRATVANCLRLLKLPHPIQGALASGELSMGHARALLSLPLAGAQLEAWRAVRDGGLSVRETEGLVRRLGRGKGRKQTAGGLRPRDPLLAAAEEALRRSLATRVRIRGSARRGTVELAYFSREELEGLVSRLGSPSEGRR